MNPALASYHFLIGSHPADLFRVGLQTAAEQRLAGETARPLVVATFGGAAVAAACGRTLPADHLGLAGCAGRAEGLDGALQTVPHAGTEVAAALPPAGDRDLPKAEWLDRARAPLAARGHPLVFVTLGRGRLGRDLPPLDPADEISCLWELGDLHPRHAAGSDPAGFGDIAERLACQPARFHGVRLYSRTARREEELRPWAELICRSAGRGLVGEHVLVLEEYDPAPAAA